MPRVSIVLPTYNGSEFIRESIESVINQTYQDWELIIINDCSTDNTLEICQEFEQKDDGIKVYSNEINKKLPASLNVGFSYAKGEYLTWTSDDNMYKPNAINYMVEYLDKNHEVDLVYCELDWVVNGKTIENAISARYSTIDIARLALCNHMGACFMYRKTIAEKVGEYDEEMFCAEDYDYWCRIAIAGEIAYSSENLYIYVNQPNNLTHTKQDLVKKVTNVIREKYGLALLQKYYNNKREILNALYDYYQQTKDKVFIKLAYKVSFLTTFRREYIFNVEKTSSRRKFCILGVKISLKRKQRAEKINN